MSEEEKIPEENTKKENSKSEEVNENISGQEAIEQPQISNIEHQTQNSNASLEQNIPNPFNHTTTINYTLPKTYSSAKIILIDKRGKVLKEINISAKGKGSLNIDASTLSSGAYQYSLYMDGKLISSKQMVFTK